jgi:hypothetical protein
MSIRRRGRILVSSFWITTGLTVAAKNRTIMSILPHQKRVRLRKRIKGLFNLVSLAGISVVIIGLCASCMESEKSDKTVLNRQEMVRILKEVYLGEAKVNQRGLSRDSSEREFERLKEVVFEKVNVSDSVFKRSFDYYMDHPKEMEMIYTALVDSLSLMEQRFDSPKKE